MKHYCAVSTLEEIERAAEKLSTRQKQKLIRYLNDLLRQESTSAVSRNRPPAERAAELERWVASHEPGPGLPNFVTSRDAIYD